MFFNRRKRYNGDVSALLPAFGIDLREAGVFKVLEVLDVAWDHKYNQYEGALLVANAFAAGLYKTDPQRADKFVNERLNDIQRDWVKKGIVRSTLVERWPQMLAARGQAQLPDMKRGSGTVLGMYRLGDYTCMLIRDAESIGPIKYLFMLVVKDEASKGPAAVVTLEHNSMQRELLRIAAEGDQELQKVLAEQGPVAMLCLRAKDGEHQVLESTSHALSAEAFLAKSLSIAAKHLGVSAPATAMRRE
jgi:hypothetical protein